MTHGKITRCGAALTTAWLKAATLLRRTRPVQDVPHCGYCDEPLDRPVEDYQHGMVCAQHVERGEIAGPDDGIDSADQGYELARDATLS